MAPEVGAGLGVGARARACRVHVDVPVAIGERGRGVFGGIGGTSAGGGSGAAERRAARERRAAAHAAEVARLAKAKLARRAHKNTRVGKTKAAHTQKARAPLQTLKEACEEKQRRAHRKRKSAAGRALRAWAAYAEAARSHRAAALVAWRVHCREQQRRGSQAPRDLQARARVPSDRAGAGPDSDVCGDSFEAVSDSAPPSSAYTSPDSTHGARAHGSRGEGEGAPSGRRLSDASVSDASAAEAFSPSKSLASVSTLAAALTPGLSPATIGRAGPGTLAHMSVDCSTDPGRARAPRPSTAPSVASSEERGERLMASLRQSDPYLYLLCEARAGNAGSAHTLTPAQATSGGSTRGALADAGGAAEASTRAGASTRAPDASSADAKAFGGGVPVSADRLRASEMSACASRDQVCDSPARHAAVAQWLQSTTPPKGANAAEDVARQMDEPVCVGADYVDEAEFWMLELQAERVSGANDASAVQAARAQALAAMVVHLARRAGMRRAMLRWIAALHSAQEELVVMTLAAGTAACAQRRARIALRKWSRASRRSHLAHALHMHASAAFHWRMTSQARAWQAWTAAAVCGPGHAEGTVHLAPALNRFSARAPADRGGRDAHLAGRARGRAPATLMQRQALWRWRTNALRARAVRVASARRSMDVARGTLLAWLRVAMLSTIGPTLSAVWLGRRCRLALVKWHALARAPANDAHAALAECDALLFSLNPSV